MNSQDQDSLLDINEAGTFLRLPIATLRYLRATDQGPMSGRVGRRVFYRQSELTAWRDAQMAATSRGGGAATRPAQHVAGRIGAVDARITATRGSAQARRSRPSRSTPDNTRPSR